MVFNADSDNALQFEAHAFYTVYFSVAVSLGKLKIAKYLIYIYYRRQCIRLW
jgi:hypothetical protein